MPTEARKFPEPQAFSDQPRLPIVLAPVDSSQVAAVGYDADKKTLAVQFKHGARALYCYPNVEPETHAAFMAAESKGVFFSEHIKALPFEKFPAEPAPEANNDGDREPAMPTSKSAVSHALFGTNTADEAGDGNPATPLEAMVRAHSAA